MSWTSSFKDLLVLFKIMKIFLTSLLILAAVPHFGTTQVFAQRKLQSKEVMVIEFLIPNQKSYEKAKIPIGKNLKELVVEGMAVNECGYPDREECKNYPYWTYTFSASAFKTGKAPTKVKFQIKVTNNCKTQKIFTVHRKRQTKIQLNCGVNLVAYYGFETEETN